MTAAIPNAPAEVTVMVVDDSALMRKLLSEALGRGEGIRVVDTAMDGQFALDHLARMRPDVVLLDVDMPRLDGLATLDRIVADYGLPVVMCSAKTTKGAEAALDALHRGAVDFVAKPSLEALTSGAAAAEIVSKVRSAASARVRVPAVRRTIAAVPTPRSAACVEAPRPAIALSRPDLVAIGISTGGPPALEQLLSAMSNDFPAGIVVVQHMPEGFTAMLASRLNSLSALIVKEASDGDIVRHGHVYIAPGGAHVKVRKGDGHFVLEIDRSTGPVSGHRPSVDVLFRSVAESVGSRALGVIMTGMGSDGADGATAMVAKGASIIAQTIDSCVCHGMPKSVIDRGLTRAVVPLAQMATTLAGCCRVREFARD